MRTICRGEGELLALSRSQSDLTNHSELIRRPRASDKLKSQLFISCHVVILSCKLQLLCMRVPPQGNLSHTLRVARVSCAHRRAVVISQQIRALPSEPLTPVRAATSLHLHPNCASPAMSSLPPPPIWLRSNAASVTASGACSR